MSDKTYQKLPVVLQTTAIKNFFESTVEQLFSKANTETAYGFIGNKTVEDLGAKGVYVPEPTANKRFYSLSPVVNNINSSTGKSQDLIFFDEFLDTLRIYGVDVKNQNKLFGEKYYSYLPPIDQDKILNFQEYYWVPGGPWRIEITGTSANPINVELDILDQAQYTPTGGKTFRDGMVVYFTGDYVFPLEFRNREFIVEGVGEKIFLVPNDQKIACKYATTTALPWDGSSELLDGSNVRHSSGQITQVNVLYSGTGYVDPTFRFIGTLAVDPTLGIQNSTCVATVDSLGRVETISVVSTPDQLYSDQIHLALELNIDSAEVLSSGSTLPGMISVPYTTIAEDTIPSTVVTGRIESRITAVDLVNNKVVISGMRFFVDQNVMTTPDAVDVASSAVIPLTNIQNARVGQYVRVPFSSVITSINVGTNVITLGSLTPITGDPEENVVLATGFDIIFQVLRTPDMHTITPSTVSINSGQVRMNVNPVTGDYYIVGGEYAFDADIDGDGIGDLPWSEDLGQRVPDYILQARGAKNNNVWSRVNFWFHKQNFIDAGQPVPNATYRAVRPIVEFDHRLELTNHGTRGLGSVSLAVTDDTLTDIGNLDALGLADSYPLLGATFILPNEPVSVSQYIYYTVLGPSGYLVSKRVPDPISSKPGALDGDPDFQPLVLKPGDTLYITGGAVNFGSEYYFTENGFVLAQEKFSVNTAPLFDLYDDQGTYLADQGVYPASTFDGNKIFGYALELGTATNASKAVLPDPVLGFNLIYRQFKASAEILFENFIDTTRYDYYSYGSSSALPIEGTRFYKLTDDVRENITVANAVVTSVASSNALVITTPDVSLFTAGDVVRVISDNSNVTGSYYIYGISTAANVANSTITLIDSTFDTETTATLGNISVIYRHPDTVFHALWKESNVPNHQLVTTSYNISQIDIDNKKTVFEIGATPRVPELNNIHVTVNGKQVTAFTYVAPSVIEFTDLEFVTGDFIEIRVNTLVGLQSVSGESHYETPLSWDHNVHNEDIEYVSEPEYLQHFRNYMAAQSTFQGDALASNNYNSTHKKSQFARDIVKTDQDLILAALLLDDQPHNLIDALRFNAAEYQKYKNRLRNEINNVISDFIRQGLDLDDLSNDYILEQVLRRVTAFSIGRNVYNRTYIVPYGDNYKEYNININDIFRTTYVSDISADLDDIQNALLVFHEGSSGSRQLIADYDYVVTDFNPITIELTGTLTLVNNDSLNLRVYDGERDSAQCPPTPSTMGLYPLHMPVIEVDDTFDNAITVIVGHDGSKTPVLGDRRDNVLLEFEMRVYNAAAKILRDANSVAEYNKFVVKPGAFRNTGFTVTEWADLTRIYFNQWITDIKVDPVNNDFFDDTTNPLTNVFDSITSDSWTWNYRGRDTSTNAVPGNWRGWYEYHYDTYRPDTHPWEMLGFTEQPNWWIDQYGTNWGSTNTAMWSDLEQGIIRQGVRANLVDDRYLTDNLFRRVGLSAKLPVDASGDLRTPHEISPLTNAQKNDVSFVGAPWRFGDLAPVENAWTYTESYPFAVVEALLLAKPGLFTTQFSDPLILYRAPVNNAYVFSKNTKKRWQFTSTTDFKIHGTTDSAGEFVTNLGYTQFIHSWLQFQGLNTDVDFGDKVRSLTVKIGHRMSGYIDKDTMTLRTDQYSSSGAATSLIIPNENIDVQIHASPYKSRHYYSGVIIEKSAQGYKVRGYDKAQCYFDILPSLITGPRERVTVGGRPADYVQWLPNNTYPMGTIVLYQGGYYRASVIISSGDTFDRNVWKRLPALPQIGGATATYYQQSTGVPARIEYEHEFKTVEETYDFLISLGRAQDAQGFDFSIYDTDISSVRNWEYAGKQFLFWTTGKWEIGNTLELSPLANKVTFQAPQGFIAKINRTDRDQFTIVDQSGATIAPSACEIVRLDDYISITPPAGQQIYGVMLFVKEIEHAMVIDNVTNFNDVIFANILNQRHRRLKIKARRTAGWTGKLLSQGYLINDEELKPNLDNLAESMGRYHELGFIPVEKQIYQAARALFGYQEREYLRELDILDDEQFEFYRGMIQSKGTAEAMKMIAESTAVLNGKLDVYDEWALRVGDFGDVENSQAIELKITKNEIINDPQLVTLAFPEDVTGIVDRIDIFARKFKYTSPPLILISPPTEDYGVQATAVATLNEQNELGTITVTNQGSGYDYTSYAQVITGSIITGLVNSRFQLAAAYSANSWIDVSTVAGQTLSLTDNFNSVTAVIDFTGVTTAQGIADKISYEPLFGGNALTNVKGNISANVFVSHVAEGTSVNAYYTLQIVGNDFTIDSAPANLYLTTGRYQPKQRYAIETANTTTGQDIVVKVGPTEDTMSVVSYEDLNWDFHAGDVWEANVATHVYADTGVTLDVNLGLGINNGATSIQSDNQTIINGEYPYLDLYINGILVRNKSYTTEMSVPYSDLSITGTALSITSNRAALISEIMTLENPGFIKVYTANSTTISMMEFPISNTSTTSNIVIDSAVFSPAMLASLNGAQITYHSTKPTVYRVVDSDTIRINIEREALPVGVLEAYVPPPSVPGEQTQVLWRLAAGSDIRLVEYATVEFTNTYLDDIPGYYLQILSTAPDGISIKVGIRRIYDITPDYQDDDLILIDIDDAERFLKKPTGVREHNLWPTFDGLDHTGVTDRRYPTIPNAGYVNRDDVNFRVFDIANLPELYGKDLIVKPRGGHTIHVANAENGNWNVYELEPITSSISYLLNSEQEVELYTDRSLYSYIDGNRIGDPDTHRYLDHYICLQNAKVSDNIVTWTAENIIQQQHAEIKKISAPRMIESRIKAVRPTNVINITNIYGMPGQVYQGVTCSANASGHNTVTISGFTNKNIRNGDLITLNSTNSDSSPYNNPFTGTNLFEVSNVTPQSLTITRASTNVGNNLIMTHCTKSRVALAENHNMRVGDVVRVIANTFSGVYTIEATPSRQSIVIDAYFDNSADKTGKLILPGLEIETTSVHNIQPDYAENNKRIAVHFAEPKYLNRVHEVTGVTTNSVILGKCLPETTEEFVYYEYKQVFVSNTATSVTLDYKPLLTNIKIYDTYSSQVINIEQYDVVSNLSGVTITFQPQLLSDTPRQLTIIRELSATGERLPVITTVDHNRIRVNGADIAIDQYNNIHGVTTSFNRAIDIRRILAKPSGLSIKFLDTYNISVYNQDTQTNVPLLSIDNYGPYVRDTTILPAIAGAPGLIVGALPLNYRNADMLDQEFNKGTLSSGPRRGLSSYDIDNTRGLIWDPTANTYMVDPPVLTATEIENVVAFNPVTGKIEILPEYRDMFTGNASEEQDHRAPAGHVDSGITIFSNTAPDSPVLDDLWYDLSNRQLMRYNGSIWVPHISNAILSSITGSDGTVYNMLNTVTYSGVQYNQYYLGVSDSLTYDIYETVQVASGLVYTVLKDRVYPPLVEHDYYATVSAYDSFKSTNGLTVLARTDVYYLTNTTIDLMSPQDTISISTGTVDSIPPVEPAFYAGKQLIPEPFAQYSGIMGSTYSGGNGTDARKNFQGLPQLAIGSYKPGSRTNIRVLSPGHSEFMLWTPGLIPGAWSPVKTLPEGVKPLGYGSGYYTPVDNHQPLSIALNSVGAYPAVGLDSQGWGATLPRFMYSRDYNVYPLKNNVEPEYVPEGVDVRNPDLTDFIRPEEIFVACFWTEPYVYKNQLVGFNYKNMDADGNPAPVYQDYAGTIVRVKYIRLTELPPNACLRRPIPDTGWGGIGWRNVITDSVTGLLEVKNEEEIWQLFAPTMLTAGGTDDNTPVSPVTTGSPLKNVCPTPAGDRIAVGEVSDRVPLLGTTTDPFMVLSGTVLSNLPLPNLSMTPHLEYDTDIYSVRGSREYKFVANWKWTSSNVEDVAISAYKKFDFHTFKIAGNDHFKVVFDFSNPKLTAAGIVVVQSSVPYAYDYDPYVGRDTVSNADRTAEETYWANAVFVEDLTTRSDGFISSIDGSQIRDYGNQLMRNGNMYEETDSNKTALRAFGINSAQAEQTTAPYVLNKANAALANTSFINNVNTSYGVYDVGVQGVGFIEGTIDQSKGQFVTVFVVYGNGSTSAKYGLFVSLLATEMPILSSQVRDSSTLSDAKPSSAYVKGADVQMFTFKSTSDKSAGYFCNTVKILGVDVETPNVYFPYHSARGAMAELVPGTKTASPDYLKAGAMPARTLVKSSTLEEFYRSGSLPEFSTVEVKGYYKAEYTGNHYFRFYTNNAEAYAWINALGQDDLSGAELYKQDGYKNGTNYTDVNATLKSSDTSVAVSLEQGKYYFIRSIFGTRYSDSLLRFETSTDNKSWKSVTFSGRSPSVTTGVDTALMVGTRAQLAPDVMLSPVAKTLVVMPSDQLPANRVVNTSVQRITGGFIVPLAKPVTTSPSSKPLINLDPKINTNNILYNDPIGTPRAISDKVNLSGQAVLNSRGTKGTVLVKTHTVQNDQAVKATSALTDIVYTNTPTINITPLARVAQDQYQAARPTIKVPVFRPTPGVIIPAELITGIKPNSELIINGKPVLLRTNTVAEALQQINRADAGVLAIQDISTKSLYIQSRTNAPITFKNGRAGTDLYRVISVSPSSINLGQGYRKGDRLRLVGGEPVKVSSGAIMDIRVTDAGSGYTSVNDLSVVVESDVGYGALVRVSRLDNNGGIADMEIIHGGIGYDSRNPPRIRVISSVGNPLTQPQFNVTLGDATSDNQLAHVAKFIVTAVDANGAVTSLKTIDSGLYKTLPAVGAPVELEYDYVVTGSLLGSVDPSRGFIPYGKGHPEYANTTIFPNGKHDDWDGFEEYKLDPLTGVAVLYTGTPGALDPDTYVRLSGSGAALKRKEYAIVLGTGAYASPLAMPGGTELMVTLATESVFSGSQTSNLMTDLSLDNEVTDINIARTLSSWINYSLNKYGLDADEIVTRVTKTGSAVSSLEIDTIYPALQLDSDVPEFLEMLGIPSGTYTANMLTFSASLSTPDVQHSAKDQNKIAEILGTNKFDTVDMGPADIISLLDARTIITDSNSLFGDSNIAYYSQLYRYTLRNMNRQPLRVVQTQGKQNVSVFTFKSLRYDTENQVTGPLSRHNKLWIDNYQGTGWAYLEKGTVIRHQMPLVDLKYVHNAIIYDRESGERELDLQLWDPFKGVLPGFIQREIDFISEVDPVTYNTARTDFGRKNLGKVWWDTSTVKYEWYEQGANSDRWQRWGAMFPGSTITVCEWVESRALPQNWTGEGRPRWLDRYITERHLDPETGKHTQYYYYWVQNRSIITERSKELTGRQLDTQTIARYIGNPQGLGVSMISFVSSDSFVLSNIAEVLREDDNIIQINFSRNLNPDGIKHTAWKLMREGDNNSVIPDYLTQKLIDSLAGVNAVGQDVPDTTLSEVDRYGIQFRPRQTMFKNIYEARRTFAAALNNVLVDLKLQSNYPTWDLDLPSDLTYFSRINWYEVERLDQATNSKVRYDSNYKPVFSVGSKSELQAYINVADGTIIQVKQTATSRPQLYMFVAETREFKLISIYAETLKVNDIFYKHETNALMSLEVRAVINALVNNVFVNTSNWNQVFFEMLKYAYMEQEQLSWAFKTTYLYVEKEEQDLVQITGFKPDNFEKILSYLNEVKPFSAKIRDYKDGKTAPIEVLGGQSIDDYDKPIYIEYGTGEQRMLDDSITEEREFMLTLNQYKKHASSQDKNLAPFRRVVSTLYFDRTNWQLTEWDWNISTTPVLLSVARNMAKLNGMTAQEISADPTIRAIDRIYKGNPLVQAEFQSAVTNYFLNLDGRWDPRLLTNLYITKPVTFSDTEIEVNNIQLLPVFDPEGINTVFIGDEKIRYKRVEGNTLKQITRGIHGTQARNWDTGELIWAGDLEPWETTSWDRRVLVERYANGVMTPGTDPLIITDTYKLYALLVEGVLDRTLALLKTAVGGDFRGESLDGRYFTEGVPGYDSDSDIFAYHGYTTMGWDTHVLDTYQIVQNFEGTFNESAINFIRNNEIYDGFDSATFKRLYGEERPEEMVRLDPLESMIMRVNTTTMANVTLGFIATVNPAGAITSIGYNAAAYGDIITRSYGLSSAQMFIEGDGTGAIAAVSVTNNQLDGMPFMVDGGSGYTAGNVTVTMLAELTPTAQNVAYQIHHNMFGGTQYLRLIDRGMVLTANASSTDSEIAVSYLYGGYELPEPSLGNPGLVWIGTECVQYFDKIGNTLRELRRGVAGTTAQDHAMGTTVWLGTASEIIRGITDPERVNWLDSDSTFTTEAWGSISWGTDPWGLTGVTTVASAVSLADRASANVLDEASIMRFLHYPDL